MILFNIGVRRFRLVATSPDNQTASIQELGDDQITISSEDWTAISPDVTLRITQVPGYRSVKIDIEAPSSIAVWRNENNPGVGEDVALLAPVPIMHLSSGLRTVADVGRVAFGSRAWELFARLDEMLKGQPCKVYIYASYEEIVSKSRVSWTATYLQTRESRGGAHPDRLKYRPESTLKDPADNLGHWAVFWEVTDLRSLNRDEMIPINRFRGL